MRIFLVSLLMILGTTSIAQADVLKTETPLNQTELGQLYGGFTLPNGIDLNIGIDNRVSVNGQAIANAQFSLNGTTVKTAASGTTHLQGVNGSTDILQLSAAGTTIISNSANNIALNQVRTITVDVTNLSLPRLQSMGTLSLLQSQAINSLRNGIH